MMNRKMVEERSAHRETMCCGNRAYSTSNCQPQAEGSDSENAEVSS